MKKELEEMEGTLGGHTALASVPCVVLVLSLCLFRCSPQHSLGFHSTVHSHHNVMHNGDCHEIAHLNLNHASDVPS